MVATEPASIVRSITTPSFVAETAVDVEHLGANGFAGLVVYGDRANEIDFVTDGRRIQIWSRRRQLRSTVADVSAGAAAPVALRVACIGGNAFRFAVRSVEGKWQEVGTETDGAFLPPWDRGVRVGLCVAGPKSTQASFTYFTMTPDDAGLFAQ
jgi:xylan 1,4-beta-xylosidase